MNFYDILLIAAIIICLVFAVKSLRKHKDGGCCGDCEKCRSGGRCEEKNK